MKLRELQPRSQIPIPSFLSHCVIKAGEWSLGTRLEGTTELNRCYRTTRPALIMHEPHKVVIGVQYMDSNIATNYHHIKFPH